MLMNTRSLANIALLGPYDHELRPSGLMAITSRLNNAFTDMSRREDGELAAAVQAVGILLTRVEATENDG